MVNTGQPSKGCYACRKRRVKCDEGKPHCQRCIVLKKDCPGYRDGWTTVVRQQNDWAKDNVSKRVEFKIQERKLNDLQRKASCNAIIPAAPWVGPEQFVINKFYSDYVLTSGTLPFLDHLPNLYSRSTTPRCLQEVVPAVALASSARQQNRFDLMEEARRRYGSALSALAQSISDDQTAKDDATLLTVFLLGLYEFITLDHLPQGRWDSHGPGRAALLRLRGKARLKDPVGRNLFVLIHHQLMISSFLGNEEPDNEFLEWTAHDFPKDFILNLEATSHRASRFCYDFRPIKNGSVRATQEKMRHMIECGMKQNSHIEKFCRSIPRDWPKANRPVGEGIDQDRYGNPLVLGHQTPEDVLYAGMTRAITFGQYRTVRIHILEAMVSILHLMESTSDFDPIQLHENWTRTVAELVEEICHDVPIILGTEDANGNALDPPVPGMALRGFSLLWPLTAAFNAIGVSPQRKSWIGEQLQFIGDGLGLSRASLVVRTVPKSES